MRTGDREDVREDHELATLVLFVILIVLTQGRDMGFRMDARVWPEDIEA